MNAKQENPINKTIRKHLTEIKEAYKDDAKPLFYKDVNILGAECQVPITDKLLIEKMIGKEINENTMMEALRSVISQLDEGKKTVLLTDIVNSIDVDKLTVFKCLELHNKVLKKLNN